MRKYLVLLGIAVFASGIALGLHASQRNCLIAFLTSGYMNFWTAIEIFAGFTALAGLVVALIGFIRKS